MEMIPSTLREQAHHLYKCAIECAQPTASLIAPLTNCLPELQTALAKGKDRNWHLFAFGKAAYQMVETVLDTQLPIKPPQSTTLITHIMPKKMRQNITFFLADHPIPSTKNLIASSQFIKKLKKIPATDPIVMLISGGGSAMLCAPPPQVPFNAKQMATQALLHTNCDIKAINIVRKHLSTVKGGQLAQIITARPIFVFVISDVIDDDLSSIASGPLVADPSTFKDAIDIIQTHKIDKQIPAAVLNYLNAGHIGKYPDTPKANHPCFQGITHKIIASNHQCVDTTAAQAKAWGFKTQILTYHLMGEAREIAQQLLDWKTLPQYLQTADRAYLAGGETTVTVTGHGKGGRNQELALSFALKMEQQAINHPWVFLSAGTDGRDGPTDAAGAIVDNYSLMRGRQAGRDPIIDLKNNNTYAFHSVSGGLIPSLPTGTNVADIQIFLSRPNGNKS